MAPYAVKLTMARPACRQISHTVERAPVLAVCRLPGSDKFASSHDNLDFCVAYLAFSGSRNVVMTRQAFVHRSLVLHIKRAFMNGRAMAAAALVTGIYYFFMAYNKQILANNFCFNVLVTLHANIGRYIGGNGFLVV
jgi:hypothetical protein